MSLGSASPWNVMFFLYCFATVGWATGRASSLETVGCWFVSGDDLLEVLWLQLSPPLPSSLVAIKPANQGSPGKMPERERD